MPWLPAVLLMIALAGASPAISAQSPPEVEGAQRLLREGKAEAAWRLLAPLEKRHAGQPEFDLALAMAATDSGRPNLATFALERLIVMQPGNGTARLELARACAARLRARAARAAVRAAEQSAARGARAGGAIPRADGRPARRGVARRLVRVRRSRRRPRQQRHGRHRAGQHFRARPGHRAAARP